MSHVFQLSDDLYAKLAAYAAQHKQTPETLFLAWASEVAYRAEKPMVVNNTEYERSDQIGKEGHEVESFKSPLLQVAGMFAIGEPGWADRHDEYLGEVYTEDHAENK